MSTSSSRLYVVQVAAVVLAAIIITIQAVTIVDLKRDRREREDQVRMLQEHQGAEAAPCFEMLARCKRAVDDCDRRCHGSR